MLMKLANIICNILVIIILVYNTTHNSSNSPLLPFRISRGDDDEEEKKESIFQFNEQKYSPQFSLDNFSISFIFCAALNNK